MIIILAAVLVGVDTYNPTDENLVYSLELLNEIIIGFFVAEVAVKIVAQGKTPLHYFSDEWNVFDILIVTAGNIFIKKIILYFNFINFIYIYILYYKKLKKNRICTCRRRSYKNFKTFKIIKNIEIR